MCFDSLICLYFCYVFLMLSLESVFFGIWPPTGLVSLDLQLQTRRRAEGSLNVLKPMLHKRPTQPGVYD